MLRIALCDDEPKVLDEVSLQIKQYAASAGQRLEICRFESALGLVSALEDGHGFDIFLLDIYIGNDMGTSLARTLRRLGAEGPIVVLTSSVEHAPESFEFGTLRYLLKPLDPEKLFEALSAAIRQAERQAEQRILLKTDGGSERLNVAHIIYSESHAHYQYVKLESGRQVKVRMTVSELFSLLGDYGGFVGVGRAYIINLRCVKNVSNTEVLLHGNVRVPIPRGKHADIKRAFWAFQCNGREE